MMPRFVGAGLVLTVWIAHLQLLCLMHLSAGDRAQVRLYHVKLPSEGVA